MTPLRVGTTEDRDSLIFANALAGVLISRGLEVRIEQVENLERAILQGRVDLVSSDNQLSQAHVLGTMKYVEKALNIYCREGIRESLIEEIQTALQK